MNEKFVTSLCEALSRIGGDLLADRARPVLRECPDPTEAGFADAISYLEQTAAAAADYGLSLPVAEYSAEFFSAAEAFITQAGNQLGFMTATESGSIYPITGIYWMDSVGTPLFYVIEIQEPEPAPPPEPHDSLAALFQDIADAIRSVAESTDSMVADQFPAHIRALSPGMPLVYQWDETTLTLTIMEV